MDPVDIPFDALWCPCCSRQIVPKRILVPDPQPTTPTRPATPSTTLTKTSQQQDAPARLTRGKTGTIRPRPQGLVHGTGRVKPNGAIKRSPTKDAQDAKSGAVPPPSNPAAVRHRTVIDQAPAPLYCSDECRLADLQSIHSAIDIKYTPDRCTSPNLPPVPPNSVSDYQSSQDDSDCSSGASYESQSSIPSPTSTHATGRASSPKPDCHVEAYSRLSAIYGSGPLPPPPQFARKPTKPSNAEPVPCLEGGVIMAARRIQAALCPEKPKRSSWGIPVHSDPEDDNKPIPGWTDGSNAWRASVYGFAPPRDFTRTDPDDAAIRAYGSYVASPHRSRGVHSTLGESKPGAEVKSSASTCSLPSRVGQDPDVDRLRRYSERFNERSKSRSRSALSVSPTGSARSLVKPGAEGRLLVPDVKMRRVNSSVSSFDGSSGTSWDGHSAVLSLGSGTGRRRSPLSRQNSDASVDTMETQSEVDELEAAMSSLPPRPTTTRSGSYSSELTYPIMPVPPKYETKIVNGVEQKVVQPPKRLFLFGGARD